MNSNQLIFFEIEDDDGHETHRMFITKNLFELKKKVKESFGLKKDVEKFYYFEKNQKKNKKIYLRTEEDYQIMMMFMNNQTIIYINFDGYYNKR